MNHATSTLMVTTFVHQVQIVLVLLPLAIGGVVRRDTAVIVRVMGGGGGGDLNFINFLDILYIIM